MKKGNPKNKYSRRFLFFIIFIVATSVIGYFLISGLVKNYYNATHTVDRFYYLSNQSDYEEIFKLIHPDFFNVTSENKTIDLFSTVNDKLGTVDSYTVINYKFNSDTINGNYIQLVYSVNRTKFDSIDYFILKKFNGDFAITGFTFNSEGFLQQSDSQEMAQLSPFLKNI